jgi:hypothetical protein
VDQLIWSQCISYLEVPMLLGQLHTSTPEN